MFRRHSDPGPSTHEEGVWGERPQEEPAGSSAPPAGHLPEFGLPGPAGSSTPPTGYFQELGHPGASSSRRIACEAVAFLQDSLVLVEVPLAQEHLSLANAVELGHALVQLHDIAAKLQVSCALSNSERAPFESWQVIARGVLADVLQCMISAPGSEEKIARLLASVVAIVQLICAVAGTLAQHAAGPPHWLKDPKKCRGNRRQRSTFFMKGLTTAIDLPAEASAYLRARGFRGPVDAHGAALFLRLTRQTWPSWWLCVASVLAVALEYAIFTAVNDLAVFAQQLRPAQRDGYQ